MSSRQTPRHHPRGIVRFLGAAGLLLAIAALAAPVGAESGWSRLARVLSPSAPEPATATAAAPQPAPLTPVRAEIVADDGSQVAALGPNGEVPLSTMATESEAGPGYNQFGKPLDLGLESEDRTASTAKGLISTAEIQRLLGDNPRFTYKAAGMQDPMLVPWVRNAAIFKELSGQAEQAMARHDLDKATDAYKRILELNDPRFHAMAINKLTEIAKLKNESAIAALADKKVVVEAPVTLPTWVTDHTTAVIVSPQQNICMIGDYMLGVGDTLPNFPEVSVASIDKDKVLYKIKDKTFEVLLANR